MKALAIAAVLVAAGVTVTADTPVKVIKEGVLDHIELFVPTPPGGTDAPVVIVPFDASKADLGTGAAEGKQTRQEEARTMQSEGPRVLAERFVATLEAGGPFKKVSIAKAEDTPPDGALVVSGLFVTIDPGSRAKRYFAGFGAGKSSVKVTGMVKDAGGRTLATFEQRRIGTMGMGGGDSLGKLMADSRNIGEDVAKFLARWARGERLDD